MKKQGKPKTNDWAKTLSRGFILLVLVACVLGFSLTMGFFSVFKSVQPGSVATVGYTFYDMDGMPVLTSDRNLAQTYYEKGVPIGLSDPLSIEGGEISKPGIVPVKVYYPDGNEYALFSNEMDTISSEIIGMKENSRKTIQFPFADTMQMERDAEQINGVTNFTELESGYKLVLGFSDELPIGLDNVTPVTAQRWVTITNKTADGANLEYGYSSVEINVMQIAG